MNRICLSWDWKINVNNTECRCLRNVQAQSDSYILLWDEWSTVLASLLARNNRLESWKGWSHLQLSRGKFDLCTHERQVFLLVFYICQLCGELWLLRLLLKLCVHRLVVGCLRWWKFDSRVVRWDFFGMRDCPYTYTLYNSIICPIVPFPLSFSLTRPYPL